MPSKRHFKHTLPGDVEALFIEVNLRNIKFLLVGTYHPPSQTDHYYFECINNAVFMTGDFNEQVTEKCISDFLFQNELCV